MPLCDARYDVILSDGFATWRSHNPRTHAVVDFDEERDPDDWGEPGRLRDARLVAYVSSNGKVLGYRKPRLLLNGEPVHTDAKHRRYLRWKLIEPDPPPHDEYEWIDPP